MSGYRDTQTKTLLPSAIGWTLFKSIWNVPKYRILLVFEKRKKMTIPVLDLVNFETDIAEGKEFNIFNP